MSAALAGALLGTSAAPSSNYRPTTAQPNSRHSMRLSRCVGTAKSDARQRQEWQIVQPLMNLRDFLP